MALRRALTRQGDLLKLSGDTFAIKEELKRLGARFDGSQKCWFLSSQGVNWKSLEFLGFVAPEASEGMSATPTTESETVLPSQDDASGESVWSVSKLTQYVESIFRKSLAFDFWIVGEISSLKSSSGHVFFELIEPEQERVLQTGRAASIPCCLWAGKFRTLQEKLAHFPFADGIKIKLLVHCDFRKEGARLNLIVDDIDPQFTLGDLAIQRQNIVRELKRRGLYDRQRTSAVWPEFPLRIALLTASGSRAQTDFMDELKLSGLAYQVTLFDCHMQGEKVESEVTAALSQISALPANHFDCVVITRGGGSRMDLRWFDNLEICKAIAYCPLPVLTAIGHFEDVSIADEVSSIAEKTPTGAARFLSSKVSQNFDRLLGRLERLARSTQNQLRREKQWLDRQDFTIEQSARRRLERESSRLHQAAQSLRLVERTSAQPLRWGYSILRSTQGRVLNADDFLTTGWPQDVCVELLSTKKNAQVLLEMHVTGFQSQALSFTASAASAEKPANPNPSSEETP